MKMFGTIVALLLAPILAQGLVYGPVAADNAALMNGNFVVEVEHKDFTTATTNTAQTIELFSVDDTMGVEVVAMLLNRTFEEEANAAHNSTSITVGDGGDPDRFLTATELNVNGTEVKIKYGTGTQNVYTSADTVDLVVTPSALDAVSELDKGKVTIYFRVYKVD